MANEQATEQELAQKLLQTMQAMYTEQPTFQRVDCKTFRQLNHKFYLNAQKGLEKLGFRLLTDIEDVTVSQTNPAHRALIQILLSSDRTTIGSCYQFPR